VKSLTQVKNLVSNRFFRPSTKSRLDKKLNSLNLESKRDVYFLAKNLWEKPDIKNKLRNKNVNFLEASIEMYDFLHSKEFAKNEDLFLKRKLPLLIARSTADNGQLINHTWNKKPAESMHPITFISGGYNYYSNRNNPILTLGTRLSFHDLIEPIDGVMPYGEIRLAELNLGYNINTNQLRLEDSQWVKVSNYSPINSYTLPLSWRIQVSSERQLDNENLLHKGSLAFGSSILIGENISSLSLLSVAQLIYNQNKNALLYGLGLEINSRIMFSENLFLQAFVSINTEQNFKQWSNLSFILAGLRTQINLATDWGLRLELESKDLSFRYNAKLVKYF
jgi:hypothetical protein